MCVPLQVAEFLAGRWTWGDARKFLMREGSMSSASRSSMRASRYMPAALMGPQEAAKLAEVGIWSQYHSVGLSFSGEQSRIAFSTGVLHAYTPCHSYQTPIALSVA